MHNNDPPFHDIRSPSRHLSRLDDRAFLLGGTAEVPVQEHGPLRVMQAWAPAAKAGSHEARRTKMHLGEVTDSKG